MTKSTFMNLALEEARLAASRDEVPIGAVIVDGADKVIARAGNRTEERADPTAHAEMEVIRQACALRGEPRLPDCAIYVTLEPCPMCATAISFARLGRLYYGAADSKGGGIEHGPCIFHQATCHHKPELYPGIGESQAAALLRAFFQARR
jgi:tRNA(Arg) A34 adenosine deaminase TadA